MAATSFKTLAKEQCANLSSSGRCMALVSESICALMAEQPSRCCTMMDALHRKSVVPYFELCVLPLAERMPEYADAAASYWRMVGESGNVPKAAMGRVAKSERAAKRRPCRTPGCELPIVGKHLYCPSCKRQRHVEHQIASRRRQREKQVQDVDKLLT